MRGGGGGGGYYIAGGEIGRQTSEGKGLMQIAKARGGEGEEGKRGMSVDVVSWSRWVTLVNHTIN